MEATYTTGIIYKIYDIEDPTQYYIGSTIQTLEKRFSLHKYTSVKADSKFYQYVRRVGWDRMKIDVIFHPEEPVTRRDLFKLEGDYQLEQNPPLNDNIAGAKIRIGHTKYCKLAYQKNSALREKQLKRQAHIDTCEVCHRQYQHGGKTGHIRTKFHQQALKEQLDIMINEQQN
ncbi:hypothetical protein PAPYR_13173 [Paratrimastix pyriformis]|uniref:GIY-YIG domain-containing protein n=1 Tax=Paratrimastix pyriformis TaxID=342808 RepID=A0ABQ8U344_9EUKA|nr:hypothetical protein PAPYR_13173 [Paratrimastix pyriformis]